MDPGILSAILVVFVYSNYICIHCVLLVAFFFFFRMFFCTVLSFLLYSCL